MPGRVAAGARATTPATDGRYELDAWRLEEVDRPQRRAAARGARAPRARGRGRAGAGAAGAAGRAGGRRVRRPRGGRSAARRWATRRAPAGASTATSGRTSRATAAGGERILRHFGDRSPPQRERAVLRRLRRRAAARAAAARPGVGRVARRGDPVGGADGHAARRAHDVRGDHPRRAHAEDREELLRRAARVRGLVAHAARGDPRADRRADRRTAGWPRRAGRTRCCRSRRELPR